MGLFNEGLALLPGQIGWAMSLARLGDNRQVAAYYLKASCLVQAEGRWWLGLGLALEADGGSGDAKEAFRHSLATGKLPAELLAMKHLR